MLKKIKYAIAGLMLGYTVGCSSIPNEGSTEQLQPIQEINIENKQGEGIESKVADLSDLPITFGLSVEAQSKYMLRGLVYDENPVVQASPIVTYTLPSKTDISVLGFFNYSIDRGNINETDLVFDVTHVFPIGEGSLSFSGGYGALNFPNSDFSHTEEFYLHVTESGIAKIPDLSLKLAYDVVSGNGFAGQVEMSELFICPLPFTNLGIPFRASASLGGNDGYYGTHGVYGSLGLSVPLKAGNGNLSLEVNTQVGFSRDFADRVWVGAGYSF